MSYTPVFGAKARPQWRALDPELQELVLDAIESLAKNPPPAPAGEHLHDFVHVRGADRHYLFVRLFLRHQVRTLTVTSIGHLIKPISPTPGRA